MIDHQNNIKCIWEDLYSDSSINKLPWSYNQFPEELILKFLSDIPQKTYILDYGSGNGRYSRYIENYGYNVVSLDISEKALAYHKKRNPSAKTINAAFPVGFELEEFSGILNWGVFHHIDPIIWEPYFDEFFRITKHGGYILFGGFSIEDFEFHNKTRISPYTKMDSYAIDGFFDEKLYKNRFEIIDLNYFRFKEAFTNKNRVFCYYILRKTNNVE